MSYNDDHPALRALVRRTCHTPLLVAGCFVPVEDYQRTPGLRPTVATYDEMLLALEFEIRALQMANTYLRSQLTTPAVASTEPPLSCGCAHGAHPDHTNMLEGGAERDGRICKLGWPRR